MKYLSVNKQKAVNFDNFTYLIKDGYIRGSRNLTTYTLKFLLLEALIVSLIFLEASPTVLSNHEKTILSENNPTSRVLYLNDSWNDAPKELRTPTYDYSEIRKIEVEADAIIISANGTLRGEYGYPVSTRSNYIIFFDTNLDGVSDVSWRFQKDGIGEYSQLYRFSDDKIYYNGTWHRYSYTSVPDFEGVITENSTTNETTFYLGGVINGTVRIKVASMATVTKALTPIWKGDLVPGGNFTDATKIGKNFGPSFKNACDTVFPYNNDTVTLGFVEPPPPPPSPPEIHLNPFLQLIVWGMNATVWVTTGIVNLPFWFRDNAVYGGTIMAVILFSSYSLVKKWRMNKQRLKGTLDSAE